MTSHEKILLTLAWLNTEAGPANTMVASYILDSLTGRGFARLESPDGTTSSTPMLVQDGKVMLHGTWMTLAEGE